MTDSSPGPHPDTREEAGVGSGREATTGTPRWVKVFGIIALVLVLLVGVMLLAGGNHGPGRHIGAGHGPDRHAGAAGHVPPAGAAAP